MAIDSGVSYRKIICMVMYVSVSRIDFSVLFLYPFILKLTSSLSLGSKQTLRAKG